MQLKRYYQTCIEQLGYVKDPQQILAVESFSELQTRLAAEQDQTPVWYAKFNFLPSSTANTRNKGLYVWGGVGRGKTWIMDLFYNSTPIENKIRLHFHQFMRQIHHDLHRSKGQRDPLKKIAKQWAAQYRLICLDEFHVTDITDAMLLYGLLDALFSNNVIIVTTSNIHPDELYKNGLQRERFIPAIELIKQKSRIVNLGGDNDFRLRGEKNSKVYYSPLTEETDQLFTAHYDAVCTHAGLDDGLSGMQAIVINNREIDIIAKANTIIWFSFQALCCTARSTIDYIEIAQHYHSVFISEILQMNDAHDDRARRFINMIDVFYDHKIRLILSAETTAESLYQGHRLQFEFGRTLSRIKEMQTREYLDRSRAAQEIAA